MKRERFWMPLQAAIMLILVSCTGSNPETTPPPMQMTTNAQLESLAVTIWPSDTPVPMETSTPTETARTTLTSTATESFSLPIEPGPVITKENATQVRLLGTIPVKVNPHCGRCTPAWSKDGSTIAVAGEEGVIFVDPWRMRAKELLPTPNVDKYLIMDLDYSPDGKTLAIGTTMRIYFYDQEKGEMNELLGTQCMYSLEYSHTGKYIAVGVLNGMDVLSGINGDHIAFLENGQAYHHMSFSPDDKFLATTGVAFGGLVIFRTDSWKIFFSQEGVFGSMKYSPNGNYFIINNQLYNSITMKTLQTIGGDNLLRRDPDFGIESDFVSIVSERGLEFWDLTTMENFAVLEGFKSMNYSYSDDGRMIAGFCGNNNICIYGIPVE